VTLTAYVPPGVFPLLNYAQTVEFYQDLSGAYGYWSGWVDNPYAAKPILLGTADANSNWTASFSNLTGPLDFFVVAIDDLGLRSLPVYATVTPDVAPLIGSLTVSSDRYTPSDILTLTASGVSATDGQVSSVEFYRGNILIGDGAFDGADWMYDFDTTGYTGPQTFYAVATDDQGVSSCSQTLTATERSPASIGSLGATHDPQAASGVITLSAGGIDDPEGTLVSVAFYESTNGSINGATLLGTGTQNADGTWSIDANMGTTAKTFFAVATDTAGLTSDPVAMSVNTTLDWDPAGWGSATPGGAGEWTTDPLALNWYDPLTGTDEAWSNAAGNVARFAGDAATVDVSSDVAARGIQFASDGYTLDGSSGGMIALGGLGVIDVAAGATAAIGAPITASSAMGLIKTSAGTLIITAAPTLPSDSLLGVSQGRLKFDITSSAATIGTNVGRCR
jgi:hypothetical protein